MKKRNNFLVDIRFRLRRGGRPQAQRCHRLRLLDSLQHDANGRLDCLYVLKALILNTCVSSIGTALGLYKVGGLGYLAKVKCIA
jgi:hypothetical protein